MNAVENLRAGGEGRHYDELARRAGNQAQQADSFASDFISAIKRNRPTAKLESGHDSTPYDLASAIGDHLCDEGMAAGLINAMSLTLVGKYEDGTNALLDWMQAAALKYGITTAELIALQGEE